MVWTLLSASGCWWCVGVWWNLNEVSGAAVNVDVRQLQTDDFTGFSDDEGCTGQLRLRGLEGEVAIIRQHIQAPYKPHCSVQTKQHFIHNSSASRSDTSGAPVAFTHQPWEYFRHEVWLISLSDLRSINNLTVYCIDYFTNNFMLQIITT